ncbi:hypothetical protein EWI07_07545 [Sporolactobacillus sp. THM7-4]|nr:hypothetical protein EWI07_07545 [Sporolactobacillus sp. THM7-4]
MSIGHKETTCQHPELVEELLMAYEEQKLSALEKRWLKFDVVMGDELGYVPFSKTGSELLFQIKDRIQK